MLMPRRNKIDSLSNCHSEKEEEETYVSLNSDEMVEELLVRTRRLMVVGEIDEVVSTHICNYLQLFSLTNEPIYMYIHSPGGCLTSGYAIVDQMLLSSCPIYTIVRGQANSMSAIIAAFGTKGCRYATANSSIMLHSIIIGSTGQSIEKHVGMLNHVQVDYNKKVASLAKQLKVNQKTLLKMMQETKWMSPDEAITVGLIDGIWTPELEKRVSQ